VCKGDNSESFRTYCVKIILEIVTVLSAIGDKRKTAQGIILRYLNIPVFFNLCL